MYGLNDRWQDYIDAGWAVAQIETGPRPESTCTAVQYGRTAGDVTIAAALDAALVDGEDSAELIRWLALFMMHALDATARERLLEVLGKLDPPTAALVYCRIADLTDREDEILMAAFMPVMGVMRSKVESGTLARAKDGG